MKLIVVWALIFLMIAGFANAEKKTKMQKVDPIMAGVMSWYVPGLGQLYSGDYFKGTLIWCAENAILISAILSLAELDFYISKEAGFQVTFKWKQKITTQNYIYASGLFIGYFIFHIYNVIDAISSAYNKDGKAGYIKPEINIDYSYQSKSINTFISLNNKF